MHRLKKNGDGNSFTNDSTVKEIATAVIGTFDGLSSKVSRVESIARELQAWSRRRQNWSPHRRRLRARRGAADHEHHEPRRNDARHGFIFILWYFTNFADEGSLPQRYSHRFIRPIWTRRWPCESGLSEGCSRLKGRSFAITYCGWMPPVAAIVS